LSINAFVVVLSSKNKRSENKGAAKDKNQLEFVDVVSSSSSSCPLGLAPVRANHLRDQIFPCPPILRKVEQGMSTALTPFCYVIQPFSAWTSPSRFSAHFTKYYMFY
jgi:hypothetical protein